MPRAEDHDLIVETARALHVTPVKVFEGAYRNKDGAAIFFHHEWLIYETIDERARAYCRAILTEVNR